LFFTDKSVAQIIVNTIFNVNETKTWFGFMEIIFCLVKINFHKTMELFLPMMKEFIISEKDNLEKFLKIFYIISENCEHSNLQNSWFDKLVQFKIIDDLLSLIDQHFILIVDFLSDYFEFMMKNFSNEMKFIAETILKDFNVVGSEKIMIVTHLLEAENKTNQKIGIDRCKILSIFRNDLEEISFDLEDFHIFLLDALFDPKFPYPSPNEDVIFILNELLNDDDPYDETIKILPRIFQTLKLDSFPLVKKAFDMGLNRLQESFPSYANNSMIFTLEFIYSFVKIFENQLEEFISKTNFVEMIVHFSMVGRDDKFEYSVYPIAAKILMVLCSYSSNSLKQYLALRNKPLNVIPELSLKKFILNSLGV
jgi:hypothetical protein